MVNINIRDKSNRNNFFILYSYKYFFDIRSIFMNHVIYELRSIILKIIPYFILFIKKKLGKINLYIIHRYIILVMYELYDDIEIFIFIYILLIFS